MPSCLEEAGGPDCLYVSPDDPIALANAMKEMIEDEYVQERISRAKKYITRFENTNVAEQVCNIYRQLL